MRALALLLTAFAVFAEAPAHAKVGLQAAATVAGGYDTNPIMQPVGEPVWVLTPRAELILSAGGPASAHRLSYTLGGYVYLRHSSADTYANTLDYQAVIEPSRNRTLILSAGLSEGRIATLRTLG